LIVDTSALVAIVKKERSFDILLAALLREAGYIPAPVIVEFHRVTSLFDNAIEPDSADLLSLLLGGGLSIIAFDETAATIATTANGAYGSGNGRGGRLNMLDLMVYGMAKARGLPILCTGSDFATTDALIHPASRLV
jgi:ribonuclease VapC